MHSSVLAYKTSAPFCLNRGPTDTAHIGSNARHEPNSNAVGPSVLPVGPIASNSLFETSETDVELVKRSN